MRFVIAAWVVLWMGVIGLAVRHGRLLRGEMVRVASPSRLVRGILGTLFVMSSLTSGVALSGLLLVWVGARSITQEVNPSFLLVAVLMATAVAVATGILFRLDGMAIGFTKRGITFTGFVVPWHWVERISSSEGWLKRVRFHPRYGGLRGLVVGSIVLSRLTHDRRDESLVSEVERLHASDPR